MPSEKKKCGACKDKLTREGYAKEQWQKEESERRCLACVSSGRPNTAAQTPEEKAERDAFVKACVEALSRRSDVTNHTRATEARRRAESVDAPTEDFAVNAADVPPPPPARSTVTYWPSAAPPHCDTSGSWVWSLIWPQMTPLLKSGVDDTTMSADSSRSPQQSVRS